MQALNSEIRRPLHHVSVGEKRVWGRQRSDWRRYSEVSALFVDSLVQAEVILVHKDFCSCSLFELRSPNDVIKVTMRDEDPLAYQTMRLQLFNYEIDIAPRVNYYSLFTFRVTNNAAVAL